MTLSVFVYHVIIKTKVIIPGAYVTLSVFVYHVIIKTKVILPGAYPIMLLLKRGNMWGICDLISVWSIMLLLKLR